MYRVRLEPFEGPLDLLLFFIRRDEIDIHDIPISRIADEFLDAVRTLEQIDLDAAADFIYTAALLIQIKVKMLLPRPELDEDGEPIDPRAELVERLLEYVRFKEAAGHLAGRFEARQRLFVRGQAADERQRLAPGIDTPVRATLFDLVSALNRALARAEDAGPADHEVVHESYTLVEQREWLMGRVQKAGESFVSLVSGRSKSFVIVTFLAVLDLAQRQAIRIVFGVDPEDFGIEAGPQRHTPALAA